MLTDTYTAGIIHRRFKESGYLFMATEAGLDTLIKNNQVQVALAVRNGCLTRIEWSSGGGGSC